MEMSDPSGDRGREPAAPRPRRAGWWRSVAPRTTCARVRRELPLAVGHDAVPRPGAWLWEHLRACPECRREFAGLSAAQRVVQELAALPEPAPGFFAQLEHDTLVAVAGEPRRPRPRRHLVRYAVITAAGLACGLAVWFATEADRPGARLLQHPARIVSTIRPLTPASGWIVPVSFTPSRQGLRGLQQMSRDPLESPMGRSTR